MATSVLLVLLGMVSTPVGDSVVLRDGRVLVGLVIEPAPRSGGSAIVVSRSRAEKEWPDLVKQADQAEEPRQQQVRSERLRRLQQWRVDRKSQGADRIGTWLDDAIAEATKPDVPAKSRLVELKVRSSDLKSVTKGSRANRNRLSKAWLIGLEGAEESSGEELGQALEGRGVDLKTIGPVSLETILPPSSESNDRWLIRRASTEVLNDEGLRFIRYDAIVMAEPTPGQPPNLQAALGSIGNLTSLLSGEAPRDPWPDRLREIEGRGKIGAILTTLRMAPDFSQVSVDVTLWLKLGPNRWVPSGTRSGVVRTDSLPGNAGANLAEDPQIKGIFQMVEGLGLGQLPEDLKKRSLNVGSATQQALGIAREAADRDLRALGIDIASPRP